MQRNQGESFGEYQKRRAQADRLTAIALKPRMIWPAERGQAMRNAEGSLVPYGRAELKAMRDLGLRK